MRQLYSTTSFGLPFPLPSKALRSAAQGHARDRDSREALGNTQKKRQYRQTNSKEQRSPRAAPLCPRYSIFRSDCHLPSMIRMAGAYTSLKSMLLAPPAALERALLQRDIFLLVSVCPGVPAPGPRLAAAAALFMKLRFCGNSQYVKLRVYSNLKSTLGCVLLLYLNGCNSCPENNVRRFRRCFHKKLSLWLR